MILSDDDCYDNDSDGGGDDRDDPMCFCKCVSVTLNELR